MSQTITIQGQLYSSKNSKKIIRVNGRTLIADSDAVRKNVKVLKPQLLALKPQWERMCAGRAFPLAVRFKIYRKTRGRFDYINITQSLQDMMVKCGWLPDDNADVLLPVFDLYEVDKHNPRVELEIVGAGDEVRLTKEQISLL